MKKSELLQMKNNLESMERWDLESLCSTLIDAVLVSHKRIAKPVTEKSTRRVNPDSKSEQFKRDPQVFPAELSRSLGKKQSVFLHETGGYIYCRTKEFGTGKTIDKPISHYVWKLYYGKMPTEGRKLLHVDKDKRNNTYTNLHPADGVYT